MQPTIVLLLVVSVVGVAQSQTWTGTYTADSSCNTTVCCCMTGQVVLTISSTNNYSISSSMSGTLCGNVTIFSGPAYTNGYTGWMLISGVNNTLTLSSDSKNITLINPTAACSGKGVKSGAIKQHANIIMLLAMALLCMTARASNK